MPAFSIIVPAYNVEHYLDEALASVAGQSFTDFEVMIVDDGSTDGTAAIAQRYCETDSRFRYVYQPNRGQSAARNLGTSLTTGSYVYYMDSDDLIDIDTLSVCHREFGNPEMDAVMFEAAVFPNDAPMYKQEVNGYRRPLGTATLWSDEFVVESLRQGRYFVSPCCFITRRSAIGNLRFVEGIVYEDNHFFAALLLQQRIKLAVLNQALFKRRLRMDSTMFTTKTLHHYNSMYRLLHEISELSFIAIESPARARIKQEIIGKTLGDLHFASALVGPDLKLRCMNVAATWYVATHISPRLFSLKRLLLAVVPELYRLKPEI
ncbi:glycosyltransferase family 2 protein [Burkholderia sp. WSM2230]|uniref:glycosyltransferase family 2 protein n=1 Tax=Burkholderia sp. WSM2230 TaxID=944435 RepID=UPI000412535C|nr:glycosyltransferase family 2 protein [Burkholderia sp. WSM2230]